VGKKKVWNKEGRKGREAGSAHQNLWKKGRKKGGGCMKTRIIIRERKKRKREKEKATIIIWVARQRFETCRNDFKNAFKKKKSF